MGSFIGIDLGTTFSALARIDETGGAVVVHSNGQNIMPSCVAFENSEPIVGEAARRMWDGKDKASRFKREMGTSKVYTLAGKRYTPTDLSAMVLKKLIDGASPPIGDIEEVVVTVPANFANEAREATLQAAREAGLNIRFIINEPTAAALYYSHHEKRNIQGIYAVYDLGGGTFDVSIIRVEKHDVEVLCSNGVHKLGGMDFDEALQKIVAKKYLEDAKEKLEPGDYHNGDAEDDKKSLSERDQVTARANRKAITVTRQEFEEAISSYVTQTELLCESTIEEAGLKVSDIRGVLCAGGSTRVPVVRESIKRVFGKEPICSVNVDEVVALGAAVYAAHRGDQTKLSNAQKERIGGLNLSECTGRYYGTIILTRDESGQQQRVNSILIEKNAKIPGSVTKTYYTVYDNQTTVDCTVTECATNETDPQFVTIEGNASLELPQGRPAGQAIDVTFSYHDNQTMQCFFIDVETKKKIEITVRIATQQDHEETNISNFTVE